MSLPELLQALKEQAGAITVILAALAAVVTAAYRVRTHLSRSRLLKSDAFPLPEVPGEQVIFAKEFPELNTLLVGRGGAVREVSAKVRSSALTFVYGESGSGKSTFLKLGLCRELVESWAPIYIDVWGTDWVGGPWKSLADATDFAVRALGIGGDGQAAVTRESVFEQLRTLRARTGRRPLLIFDQVDDYQNAHRARFQDPVTQFFLSPDELCNANPFWKEVRNLLLHLSEPAHIVLATREDAQGGLYCFEFTEPSVYRLPRLDPQDAKILIQRLSPEGVIRNPENGFTELIQRIVAELGRDGQGAILPMQLRIALAGLGRLNGPLTPGRLDKLGGVPALGALYLDAVLRTSPEAWPILNAMAERTATGMGKAITLSRERVLALIPSGAQKDQLLQHLAATRILRQRLAGSPQEVWQLYHDYLADAIITLDRRKRKWWLVLSDAAERFRLSDGIAERWARLLSPAVQLRLLWQRLKDREFRYREYAGFASLSLIRLVVNPWTLSLAIGAWGWAFWQETREAQEIVDAFHQGDGHEKEEYDALWRLAACRSDRTIRAVFVDSLSTRDSAAKFFGHSKAIQASLGLRASSLDALRGVSITGPCTTPADLYIPVCSMIAQLSGEQERFADRIVELLAEATGSEAADLGRALPALAVQVKGNQTELGANRIVELLDKATGSEAMTFGLVLAPLAAQAKGNQAERGASRILELGRAAWAPVIQDPLAALAAQAKGYQAERLANRIVELLGTAKWQEAEVLGSALAALAAQVKGDQAERLANRIVELWGSATWYEAGTVGGALAALAAQVKGDQAERLANRIVELLDKAGVAEAVDLGGALAALAAQAKGGQAERGANRIVDLLDKAKGPEAAYLGSVLAALAVQAKGDQAERGANRIVERLSRARGFEAADLGNALAALAAHVKGNQVEHGANHIAGLLGKARGFEAARLGRSLAALAAQMKGDQAERLASRIVELLGGAGGSEAMDLGNVLAALAANVKGSQTERGASRMVELLGKARDGEAVGLGRPLMALAAHLKGDQVERLASRIVELLDKGTGNEAGLLGILLAELAVDLKGDQAERGANRIVELLERVTANETATLPYALAPLAAHLKSDQAERLANRILEQMDKAKGSEAEAFGDTLAPLAARVKSDQLERALLTKFVEQRRPMPCDAAVVNAERSELLVDMLKWPVCEGRDQIMLRIADLQRARPTEFGEFKEPGKRSTFHGDLRRFIAWLKTQRDSNGKPFNVDGPPVWSPGHSKEAWLATSQRR
jgi:hypothetical protein